jgi:hypothetical protein
MFLSGNRDGVIVSVQQVSIHGTIMMNVSFPLKNDTVARCARIGPEAVSGALAPGAAVVVTGITIAYQTEKPGTDSARGIAAIGFLS